MTTEFKIKSIRRRKGWKTDKKDTRKQTDKEANEKQDGETNISS